MEKITSFTLTVAELFDAIEALIRIRATAGNLGVRVGCKMVQNNGDPSAVAVEMSFREPPAK